MTQNSKSLVQYSRQPSQDKPCLRDFVKKNEMRTKTTYEIYYNIINIYKQLRVNLSRIAVC